MKLISPALIFVGTAVIKLRKNLKVCVFLIGFTPSLVFADECVVLLHGLARISNSMGELESKLSRAGFSVINVEYPSLKHGIETLSAEAVGQGIQDCLDKHWKNNDYIHPFYSGKVAYTLPVFYHLSLSQREHVPLFLMVKQ